jgi:hypothetical protein
MIQDYLSISKLKELSPNPHLNESLEVTVWNLCILNPQATKIMDKIPFVVKIFQMLVSTLLRIVEDEKNKIQMYSGGDEEGQEEDDEDEDDEYGEDEVDEDLRLTFQDEDDDEDEDGLKDPYAKDDEIYHLDLKKSLKDGILEIFNKQRKLVELSISIMSEKEKKFLQEILK